MSPIGKLILENVSEGKIVYPKEKIILILNADFVIKQMNPSNNEIYNCFWHIEKYAKNIGIDKVYTVEYYNKINYQSIH